MITHDSRNNLPKSDATNAYDLLTDVCKVIDAEPKRINMGFVCIRGAALQRTYGCIHLEIPSCNTIGCIAGWCLVTKQHPCIMDPDIQIGFATRDAQLMLGLSYDQGHVLFWPVDLLNDPNKQSRAHADAVIAHIKTFQAKYPEQLLAKGV